MTTRNYDSSDLTRLIRDRAQYSAYSIRTTVQNSAPNGIDVPGINPQTGITAQSEVNNLINGGYTTYYRAFPTTVISVPFNTLGLTNTPGPGPPPILPFIYSFVYTGGANVLDYVPVITTTSLTISSSYVQVGTTYTVTVELVGFTDNGTTTDGISFNSTPTVNSFYANIPVTVEQFGSIPLSRRLPQGKAGAGFSDLQMLTILPTTVPVILPNTPFVQLFSYCRNFNSDISQWDTTNVTNMSEMFLGAAAFNQPIGLWNTAAVTSMEFMFYNATNFNQNISYSGSGPIWNTAAVTIMSNMFFSATNFNNGGVPLNWLTTGVTIPISTFRRNSALTNPNNVNNLGQQIGL